MWVQVFKGGQASPETTFFTKVSNLRKIKSINQKTKAAGAFFFQEIR
jgi:hypothetical protein